MSRQYAQQRPRYHPVVFNVSHINPTRWLSAALPIRINSNLFFFYFIKSIISLLLFLSVINITCAYFGIDPNTRNPNGNYNGAPRKYFSQTSTDYIRSTCNGQNSCSLSTSNTLMIDSGAIFTCEQFQCAMFAQWDCISSAMAVTTRATTTQPPTTVQVWINFLFGKTFQSVSFLNSVFFKITTGIPTCPYSQIPENGTCQSTSPYEPEYISNSSQLYFGYPISTLILCEDARLILVCPNDLVVHIYAAYFGVQQSTSTSACVDLTTTSTGDSLELNAKCYVRQGFDVIQANCEGKSRCDVRATAATMGGPNLCPEISKQVFVQYQCVDSKVN